MRRRKFNSLRKFEKLEDRRMMAADIDLDNGVLTIEGTNSGDSVIVYIDPNDPEEVEVIIRNASNGDVLAQEDYDREDIQEIVVNLLDGQDFAHNRTDIRSRLYGGNDRDLLEGGSGNDLLDTGSGDDYLIGRQGDDELVGGVGSDRYYFSYDNEAMLGSDLVVENDAQDVDILDFQELPGPVQLDLATTAHQVVNPDHLTLRLTSASGIEHVYGSDYNDVIRGNIRDNVFLGYDGNDTLYGSDGIDRLFGGNGNDFLFGQAGDDYLSGGEGDDIIRGGDGADMMSGENGNDSLYGENGLDTLYGHSGDDFLDGGFDAFQDQLTGGSGSDRFVQHRKRLERYILDQMLDFTTGTDAVFTDWH